MDQTNLTPLERMLAAVLSRLLVPISRVVDDHITTRVQELLEERPPAEDIAWLERWITVPGLNRLDFHSGLAWSYNGQLYALDSRGWCVRRHQLLDLRQNVLYIVDLKSLNRIQAGPRPPTGFYILTGRNERNPRLRAPLYSLRKWECRLVKTGKISPPNPPYRTTPSPVAKTPTPAPVAPTPAPQVKEVAPVQTPTVYRETPAARVVQPYEVKSQVMPARGHVPTVPDVEIDIDL